MYFSLDDLPVQSPKTMQEVCNRYGFDMSSWLGKANCFVDRRGPEPSYGYFLVDYSIIERTKIVKNYIQGPSGGTYVAQTGANKLDLRIVYDEKESNGQYKERTIEDMYVSSYESITPSWNGEDSYYLIHLVDVRFIFNKYEASEGGLYNHKDLAWFNRVIAYLTPAQLKAEYELEQEPEHGYFIYEENTTASARADSNSTLIGHKEGEGGSGSGVEVRIPTPFTWEQLFNEFFESFCDNSRAGVAGIFPYFEGNEWTYELDTSEVEFPEFTPQHLCTSYIAPDVFLRRLLFWTQTSLIYLGKGKLKLIPILNEEKIVGNTATTDFHEYIKELGAPSDGTYYNTPVPNSTSVPEGISFNLPIIDWEREDNLADEYNNIPLGVLFNEGSGDQRDVGRQYIQVLAPQVWTDEREQDSNSTIEEKETLNKIREHYRLLVFHNGDTDSPKVPKESIFKDYPTIELDYTGFRKVEPGSFIERVSIYDLGKGPYTKIESILPIMDWDWITPQRVPIRENKFSIILAKVSDDVSGGEENNSIVFKDVKVLTGDGPTDINDNIAYNTFNQDYKENDPIILVRGYSQEWRDKSRLAENTSSDPYLWYSIDDIPFLRLKVPKAAVDDIGSDPLVADVEQILLVNGKLPNEKHLPEGTTSIPDPLKITIKRTPNIKLEEGDDYFYIGYDATAGDSPLNRWTTADPDNFILHLKGIPGYGGGDDQTPYVLKQLKDSPSGLNSIVWGELDIPEGDNFEEQVNILIEAYINEHGGGGGTSNITILKALVNQEGGVDKDDATFQYSSGVALVSPGTISDSGPCDNTYGQAFVHQEPILLLKKNNGLYTAIKLQENWITAQVNKVNGVDRADTEFNIDNITLVSGTAPAASPIQVAKNVSQQEFADNDILLLRQGADNKWIVIRNLSPQTAIFRSAGIAGATYNTTSGVLTMGSGTGVMMLNTSLTQYSPTGSTIILKNMTPSNISNNRLVQAKRIGKFWFIDVEACS